MKRLIRHAAFAAACVWGGAGQALSQPALFDTIFGPLPDVVKKGDRPYLVVADISVPAGKTVTVEKGVVFLFQNFTGLQIHGRLVANGTAREPVLFTSENDSSGNPLAGMAPAPYDWNGITVTEDALGTTFDHCSIRYSLYGINSLSAFIYLIDCTFHKNGRSNCIIDGQPQDAGTAPFSFGTRRPALAAPAMAGPRSPPGSVTVRLLGLSLAAAGATAGVWKTFEYRTSLDRFRKLSDTADTANTIRNPSIVKDWNEARNKKNNDYIQMIAAYAVAALGLAGFSISFAF
jgi:hypothetical protein